MRIAHHMFTWTSWHAQNDRPLDADAMLAAIKEAGYDGVELMNAAEHFGPASATAGRLAAHGLQAAAYASFVNARPGDPRGYRADLDYAGELGITTIMVCGGWLAEPRRTTFEEDYAAFGESLAIAVADAEAHGQTIAFHPHTGCIVETHEEVERLLAHIPDLKLCIDTGHLTAVRSDPAKVAAAYPDKIVHTHLKDWSVKDGEFAELGMGDAGLDLAGYLRTLREIGYGGWYVVERDNPRVTPAESARIGRSYLARILS
ncbi:sugar phosphate isomerase/epimerase family protein [Thermoactinospora rubra]|uniref:sugar phosphate isomerase/epimerase family protein n=1 Tax=Thermoactinospora rubra TaxID=1088767 RepID=UPI000A0FFF30|nr:sugar phosphate isomerase/epimerase [Thermoactinospora rubra]